MMDPENFPSPDVFDPERYLTQDGQFQPHPKVIPFGIGKRRCMGKFAPIKTFLDALQNHINHT